MDHQNDAAIKTTVRIASTIVTPRSPHVSRVSVRECSAISRVLLRLTRARTASGGASCVKFSAPCAFGASAFAHASTDRSRYASSSASSFSFAMGSKKVAEI